MGKKKKLSATELEKIKEEKKRIKYLREKKKNKIIFFLTLPVFVVVSICYILMLLNPTYIHIYIDNIYNIELVLNSNYEIEEIYIENDFIVLDEIEELNVSELIVLMIDTMIDKNYLNYHDNMLLISVNDSYLKNYIDRLILSFEDEKSNYEYIIELISYEEDLEKIASNYELSLGKYLYIRQMIESNNEYTFASLKKLSIKDLYLKQ